ncbi:MAG: HlyD family efflux transporter periplasmic adaptor subunit [Planctomycetia bacterium]|nr:HlyD family efflux transporter periplasmic adaptor subunit [Planctomycetia bacterium]
MLRKIIMSSGLTKLRKRTLFFYCAITASIILFFGGFVCLWACFTEPEQTDGQTATKTEPIFLLPNNDQSVIQATVNHSDTATKEKNGSALPNEQVQPEQKPESGRASSTGSTKSSPRYNIYPGKVCAFKKSILTFRVPGPLEKISVVPGQVVKKGDVLMQIDPRDYQVQVDLAQSRLDAAKANLEAMRKGARPEDVALLRAKVDEAQATYALAEKEFQRAQTLVDSKTISASEYDTANRSYILASLACNSAKKELEKGLAGARVEDIRATEAQIRGLEASLASAKNSLDDTTLRAPYDGVVTTKMIEEHEMVTTTPTYRQVLGIHDISKLKIEVYVPEREMIGGHIRSGETVSVRFTARRENSYHAKLAEIDTEPSQVGMTYKLTFVLDRPNDLPILPGMISEVSLPETVKNK